MAKFDIYEAITTRVISMLEQGQIPWEQPWIGSSSDRAISRSTGKPYSLLNQMLLGDPGEYLTFKQCQEAGGKIKKGEKARMVVFWKWLKVKDAETEEEKEIPFLQYYNVFHINQCEGVEPKRVKPVEYPDAAAADETAERIISNYIDAECIALHHIEGNRAFYRPSDDSITLPLVKQFKSTAEYYSTAFHELTHSTGHKSRLDRLAKIAAFGSEEYSKEELVAEIGAASLMHHCGLETVGTFRNTAAYIQSWIKALRNDKKMIVSAAGKAEKAVSRILEPGAVLPF